MLAQPPRRGERDLSAHDHADSHLQLLRLLENGDHDGASHHLARHLAEAEADLLDALDLG